MCSQHGVLSNVFNIYLHWLQNEIKAALAPPACVEESRARIYSRCAPVIHLSRLSLCDICFVFVVTHTVGIPVTHPDPDSLKMQNEEVFDTTSLCSFKLLQRRSSVAGSLHSADAYSYV